MGRGSTGLTVGHRGDASGDRPPAATGAERGDIEGTEHA